MSSNENELVEGTGLVEDLKFQLRKAEEACEQYRKELSALQLRLDEALRKQTEFHEVAHVQSEAQPLTQPEPTSAVEHQEVADDPETRGFVNGTVKDQNPTSRRRSLDTTHGLEDISGEVGNRGRSSTIQRKSLKSPLIGNEGPGPDRLLDEKERMIEELKLELQESHSRRAEVEDTTSQQIRELEKILLDAQSANIRTAGSKDNKSAKSTSDGTSNRLNERWEEENSMKSETQLKTLQEQNTALTEYINRIVTRLIQHDSFQDLFQNSSTGDDMPVNTIKELQIVDKALQALSRSDDATAKEDAPPQPFLKRAGSVFNAKTRSRPNSVPADEERSSVTTPPAASTDTILKAPSDAILAPRPTINLNEDPTTSMSIPLRRADSRRRRPQAPSSEWRNPSSGSARPPSGQGSPGAPRRTSYFGASTATPSGAPKDSAMSAALDGRLDTHSGATPSSDPIYGDTPTTPNNKATSSASEAQTDDSTHQSNSPRSISAASSVSGDTKPVATSGGTVFTSAPNRMRPLRLVQEKQDADDAALAERKKANRSSWMGGWFAGGNGSNNNTGKLETTASQISGPAPQQRISAQWPGPKSGSPK